METPRLDRDLGGRVDGAGRYFTREQLDAELAKVEGRRVLDASGMSHAEVQDWVRRNTSAFASSPALEKEELPAPRLGME